MVFLLECQSAREGALLQSIIIRFNESADQAKTHVDVTRDNLLELSFNCVKRVIFSSEIMSILSCILELLKISLL